MQNIRLTPEGPTVEQIAEMETGNFGFTSLKKYEGGIGYLKLDSFQDPAYAGEAAAKAMKELAASRTLIIDLRENHGGDGRMVHLLASYFLPSGTQLTSLYFRAEDRLQEAWTHDEVPGERMLGVDLLILTSKQTTSAAESFAYTLQSYGRAKLVGENTRGAGHWVESYPYPDQGIFLEIPVARPINPVTKKGWEHSGIAPDVSVNPAEALDVALRLARERHR
jgi:C-terminal processing protease CtpA/Prc